ncbi:hypothetical protein PLICRDRAFT_506029 [Plicaturopsis crispa FD-325 SS-3]|nr:hypothetical protein PLICRDRAFT_506029 [Plicaturopsis crispa FD-325 SS-3]
MDGSRASTPASGHSLATPELHDDAPGAAALRASLARFSYTPSPSPRQRSPTKPSPLPSLTSPQAGPSQPKRKRRSLGLDGEVETTSRSPKKPKRGYADPDTYSHLHFLQDHLKEELDGTQLLLIAIVRVYYQ